MKAKLISRLKAAYHLLRYGKVVYGVTFTEGIRVGGSQQNVLISNCRCLGEAQTLLIAASDTPDAVLWELQKTPDYICGEGVYLGQPDNVPIQQAVDKLGKVETAKEQVQERRMMADRPEWTPTAQEVEDAVEAWYAEKRFDPFSQVIGMLYARKLVEWGEKPCTRHIVPSVGGRHPARHFDCPYCMKEVERAHHT